MHNIKDIRSDISSFKDGLKKRFIDVDFEKILLLDENNRKFIQEKENLDYTYVDINSLLNLTYLHLYHNIHHNLLSQKLTMFKQKSK